MTLGYSEAVFRLQWMIFGYSKPFTRLLIIHCKRVPHTENLLCTLSQHRDHALHHQARNGCDYGVRRQPPHDRGADCSVSSRGTARAMSRSDTSTLLCDRNWIHGGPKGGRGKLCQSTHDERPQFSSDLYPSPAASGGDQQSNAVESLSNIDVLCMDKTGTLTANRLAFGGAESHLR